MGLTNNLGKLSNTINSNGSNVTIGGTSTTYKFEVTGGGAGVTTGDFYVDSANNSVYVGKQSSNSGDNTKFYVRNRLNSLTALSVDPGGNGSVDVVGTFSTTRGTNLATATGNVGIGTASASTKLEILDANGIPLRIGDISSAPVSQTAGYIGLSTSALNGNNGDLIMIPRNTFNISFWTGATTATERMRIRSGGEVQIGNTSDNLLIANDSLGTWIENSSATSTKRRIRIQALNSAATNYTTLRVDGTNSQITFETADTERMRITNEVGTANVCIGTTSSPQANSGRGALTINGSSTTILTMAIGGAEKGYVYHNASEINLVNSTPGRLYCIAYTGGVYLNSGATSWTANSDERLKDITGNIDNAVDSLMSLRAVKHTWKADADKVEKLALIAQDVEKVFPQVIDKGKLPSKPDEEQTDETEYLGVRYTELIPVLVKAIQELSAKVTALENK